MMSPPGLQIYLRPRVTLTFDLLSQNLIVAYLRHVNRLCQFAVKLAHLLRISFIFTPTSLSIDLDLSQC